MFCEENGIEDMKKESQSVWNGALRYIRRHVFNNKDVLKEPNNIYNINNSIVSNYNMYNYELVNNICDIYIDLCFINDKEVSILGFSNLTGIDTELIYNTIMYFLCIYYVFYNYAFSFKVYSGFLYCVIVCMRKNKDFLVAAFCIN